MPLLPPRSFRLQAFCPLNQSVKGGFVDIPPYSMDDMPGPYAMDVVLDRGSGIVPCHGCYPGVQQITAAWSTLIFQDAARVAEDMKGEKT